MGVALSAIAPRLFRTNRLYFRETNVNRFARIVSSRPLAVIQDGLDHFDNIFSFGQARRLYPQSRAIVPNNKAVGMVFFFRYVLTQFAQREIHVTPAPGEKIPAWLCLESLRKRFELGGSVLLRSNRNGAA